MRAPWALLLAVSLAAGAAQPDVAQRPDVRIGDRWTYQRMDYDAGKAISTYEIQVVFADRGVIQVVGARQGVDEEVDGTYTLDWNAINTINRLFNPHTGWFKFPLRVGDAYEAAYETMVTKKGKMKSRNERRITVLGWEEVVVPAGKFRALKIVSDGRFKRLDAAGEGTSRNVIWYAPEVKRWVKITLENRPAGGKGRGEHTGEELVAFRVQ